VSGSTAWWGCSRLACRITDLVLNCADPEALAPFWRAVLGYEVLDADETGVSIGPPGGGARPGLTLLRSADRKVGTLRLHLDVNATDGDQDTELARLLAVGARPVEIGQTGQESWDVLADPEGHEFCLLRSTVAPA